ncbi:MAG: hypothetical protein ACJAVR_003262 [Paracoccaceae bacterium]|jgi:hypothetical protein
MIGDLRIGGKMNLADLPQKIIGPWNNKTTPIVIRSASKGVQLALRTPYADDNKFWVNRLASSRAVWDGNLKAWILPMRWLNNVINRSLERCGSIYVVQPYNDSETCAPACRNATGHVCECSCMGEFHGTQDGESWFDVSETFAIRWKGPELAIRKITKKQAA